VTNSRVDEGDTSTRQRLNVSPSVSSPSCLFCHKPLFREKDAFNRYKKLKKYCSEKCEQDFHNILMRIYNVYGAKEASRFWKLGNNYRFKGKYRKLNAHYGLTKPDPSSDFPERFS